MTFDRDARRPSSDLPKLTSVERLGHNNTYAKLTDKNIHYLFSSNPTETKLIFVRVGMEILVSADARHGDVLESHLGSLENIQKLAKNDIDGGYLEIDPETQSISLLEESGSVRGLSHEMKSGPFSILREKLSGINQRTITFRTLGSIINLSNQTFHSQISQK